MIINQSLAGTGTRDGGSVLFLPIPIPIPILYFLVQPIPILIPIPQKIPIFTDTDPPSLTGTNIILSLGINLGGLIQIYSIMNNN